MITAALGDVCHIRSGGTPPRSRGDYYSGSIPWAKISDLDTIDGTVLTTEETISLEGLRSIRGRLFPAGTLLFAIYGSIGKMAFAGRDMATNQAILGLEVMDRRLAPRFLYHWLRAEQRRLQRAGQGIAQKNLSAAYLRGLEIPLPPEDDQRRIALILDEADAVCRARKRGLGCLDQLAHSIFEQLIGDPLSNSLGWRDDVKLGEVAEIVSGITKGRKPNGPTRVVPYMAVANVQDRFLLLDNVKEIEATESEILRYRLRRDDLLLTEGGDPDKLGRGALWNEELPEAIHQNHIFRVRLQTKELEPVFLNWLVGSKRGKRYFSRSAKQTTGIASINAGQLGNFPLLIPPLSVQRNFVQFIALIERQTTAAVQHLDGLDALFSSLQHRAFRGAL